jgi:hypothetical protein
MGTASRNIAIRTMCIQEYQQEIVKFTTALVVAGGLKNAFIFPGKFSK